MRRRIFFLASLISLTAIGLMAQRSLHAPRSHAKTIVPPTDYDHTNEVCREHPILEEKRTYRDYSVKTYSASDHDCHILEIEHAGKTVYRDQEIGGHYTFGPRADEDGSPFLWLTHKQRKNLVFSKWTGGAHCCFSLHIFELNGPLREVANVDGGNFEPELIDLDHDGIPEIKVRDDFLAYRFSSFASSASGKVVLKYKDGAYQVSKEYMVRSASPPHRMKEKIKLWQSLMRKEHSPDWPPPSLVQAMTDLVFSGHKTERGIW